MDATHAPEPETLLAEAPTEPVLEIPADAYLAIECAWCGVVMREGDRRYPVSHGICEPCDAATFGGA